MLWPKRLHAGFSPSSHRGILLADVAAKYSHKVLGAKLAPWLQRFQHECHFGCLPGAGTEVPSLWLQAFSALAKFRTVSFGVAFIDIVSAYYRTIRQLIVHMPSNDAELCYLWSHLQIDPAMINQVRTLVSQASALDEAHVPHELQNQLRALFRGTWFFCRGGARIAHTHTGSRPGDPIADITFAFLCNHLMRQMQDFGDQQQLSTKLQVDWVSSVPPADFDEPLVVRPYMTSWADDLALAVIDGDFELLGAKLRCTLRFLLDLAFRHGLDVNLKEDKSEVLLMLRGAGSRQQRHVSFHQGQPTFVVPDTLKGPQVFRPDSILRPSWRPAHRICFHFAGNTPSFSVGSPGSEGLSQQASFASLASSCRRDSFSQFGDVTHLLWSVDLACPQHRSNKVLEWPIAQFVQVTVACASAFSALDFCSGRGSD